jgi:general nucleoside transport system ATP-binding protein
MASEPNPVVVMQGITKRFGMVLANDHVDFTLREGEIHALLGENGAGKTTLMRILYGLYHADEGNIEVNGQPVTVASPKDAIRHGIGMVSQHFALAPPLTVTENVILGTTHGMRLNIEQAHREVQAASERFGVQVEPRAVIRDLSVGQRQRVEILKALYRDAKVLVMDEPTAVLTPQEVEQLFKSLRDLKDKGFSVVFISHKLNEVMAITDHITVLRLGKVVGSIPTRETNPGELARMMVGHTTFGVTRKPEEKDHLPAALVLDGVTALNNKGLPGLKEISLSVSSGEILGLAGVSGNGQTELAEVLAGTRPVTQGRVLIFNQDITNLDAKARMAAGLGRIPEDSRANVVGQMTVAQNMAIEQIDRFSHRGYLDRQAIRRHAQALIEEYQIKASPDDRMHTLSGGNLQKVVLARVLAQSPKVLVVAQPTRGLDVAATEYVRSKLLEQRAQGAAILLISEDMDEILHLSDTIAVLYEGSIMAIQSIDDATREELGLLMAGVRPTGVRPT